MRLQYMYQNILQLTPPTSMGGILKEVREKEELFGAITERQDHEGSCHKDTETIFLRGPTALTYEAAINDLEAIDYPFYKKFNSIYSLVMNTAAFVRAERVGRVMVVKLKPEGKVLPHVDEGDYPNYYNRFHIPITDSPYAMIQIGDERINLQEGATYMINNRILHSAVNYSKDEDRIVLIFDLRLKSNA